MNKAQELLAELKPETMHIFSKKGLYEVLGVVQQFVSKAEAEAYIESKKLKEVEVIQNGDRFAISLIMNWK